MRFAPFVALCLSLPLAATAETAAPPAPASAGAVAQFMAAQDLFALGRAQKDPTAVLAAARLAARILPEPAPRKSDPPAEALPASHPDAATMFTTARALAAEDAAMADLITRSEAEATRLPTRTLRQTSQAIPAKASQGFSLPFFGGALAEVGLLGDGTANLDLAVTDAAGAPLCLETGPADRSLCSFVLPDNGSVTVTVTNRSETAASFSLLTN